MNNDEMANRVAGGFSPPAPTPPGMRVRTGRFTKITGPKEVCYILNCDLAINI